MTVGTPDFQMTMAQRGTIKDLSRMKIALHILGIEDKSGCPVFLIKDARKWFPMTVLRDGHGREPVLPVRQFTEDEKYGMDDVDGEVLLRLPFVDGIRDEHLEERQLEYEDAVESGIGEDQV